MKQQKLSYGEISVLCLELSMFLRAGADTAGGLMLLAEETEGPLREKLNAMARMMDEGSTLSGAMQTSGIFPGDVWAMVQAGERTGRTEQALKALADYYDGRDTADRQIRSALLYPSVLFLVMTAVILVLLIRVLPIFSDVYASLGGEMTGLAGGLLRLGQLLDTLLPLVCLLMGTAAAGLAVFARFPSARERLFAGLNRRRESELTRRMSTARFALALSMGLASGLTPEEAVETAGLTLSGEGEKRCAGCLRSMAEGGELAGSLRESGLLPPAECRLLMLGISGGNGEEAAAEIARRLQREADDALERKIGQIEPAMVVVTSLLVGAILLTVMLPLTRIMTAIG